MERGRGWGGVLGWLLLASVLLLLSGGDQPVELAVWLAPAALLRLVRDTRPWVGLPVALGLLAGTSLVADRGMLPVPAQVAVVITLVSAAWATLPYAADRVFSPPLPPLLRMLVFPASTVAVQTLFGGSGTWGDRAYGIQSLPILQIASVLGIMGVAFLVSLSAAALNEIWEHRSRPWGARPVAAAYLAIMLAAYGFGEWRLRDSGPGDSEMAVAGIVPAPGHREAMMRAFTLLASPPGDPEGDRLRALMEETAAGLLRESERLAQAGAELVLTSEGAVVLREAEEDAFLRRAGWVAKEQGIHLGLGLVVIGDRGAQTAGPFLENKLTLLGPDGSVAWEYRKRNLAPGLERQWFIAGDGRLPEARSGTGIVTGAICYDMDFPRHIRQAGRMGASLLLAPSNDWPEIRETHWRMARFRAIEQGVAVLRPSSSGVSTAVDAWGRVLARVDYDGSEGGPVMASLPVGPLPTLYSRYGNAWTWGCVAGALALWTLAAVRMRRKAR